MSWGFEDREGVRRQGTFATREEAMRARSSDPDWWMLVKQLCGPRPRLVQSPPLKDLQFMADVPNHYNIGLDCEVRGRRHLKALQKEHGCRDYEPVKDSSTITEFRRKLKRRGKRIT